MKTNLLETLNSFNNATAWEFEGRIYVDMLTSLSRLEEATGCQFESLYAPTKEEVIAALTGDDESHGKVFGGRVTHGAVFVVK